MSTTAPVTLVTPNLYQLQGKNLHVTYSTSGIDGRAHFSYQDTHQSLSFRGDEIRTQETEIGTLVSVTLRRTGDVHLAMALYHGVAGADPDHVALDALGDLLTRQPSRFTATIPLFIQR